MVGIVEIPREEYEQLIETKIKWNMACCSVIRELQNDPCPLWNSREMCNMFDIDADKVVKKKVVEVPTDDCK